MLDKRRATKAAQNTEYIIAIGYGS